MKRALLILVAVFVPATTFAQDTPKVGLTMGYPASVGVIWQVADRLALRPEVTLSKASEESRGVDAAGPGPVTTGDTTSAGVAIAALVYVGRWDALRAYISPRFAYTRTSSSASSTSNTILGPATSESTMSAYQTSGMFGAQYALGRRFGLFGEAGASYVRTTSEVSSSFATTVTSIANGVLTQTVRTQTVGSSARSNAVSVRSAVGVIFFF